MSKTAEAAGEVDGVVRIDTPSDNRKPPSCCLCLDVRIGTVMIGLFNLICHAFWIVSISSYFVRQRYNENADFEKNWKTLDRFHEVAQHHQHVNHHMVAMIVASLSFLVVVMLIFGAAMRRSSYILPFFCLQVFDLCLSVLIAATVTSYAAQLKYHLEMSAPEGVQAQCIRNASLAHFRMMLVSFWLCVLLIKYFFATVVWECYGHCKKLEEQRHVQSDSQVALLLYQGDMETMNLLPSYDDVVKTAPPPAYAQ